MKTIIVSCLRTLSCLCLNYNCPQLHLVSIEAIIRFEDTVCPVEVERVLLRLSVSCFPTQGRPRLRRCTSPSAKATQQPSARRCVSCRTPSMGPHSPASWQRCLSRAGSLKQNPIKCLKMRASFKISCQITDTKLNSHEIPTRYTLDTR